MSIFTVVSPSLLRHRSFYPGEINLRVRGSSPDSGETWYSSRVEINLQYTSDPKWNRWMFGEDWQSFSKNGQIYCLYLDPKSDSEGMTTEYLLQHHTRLIEVLGDELATEIETHIVSLFESFASLNYGSITLRFTDMARYNQMLLDASRAALEHLDAGAIAADLSNFWTNVTSTGGAHAQARWYTEHDPSAEGETQADYDAEVADFKHLLDEGTAACQSLPITA